MGPMNVQEEGEVGPWGEVEIWVVLDLSLNGLSAP